MKHGSRVAAVLALLALTPVAAFAQSTRPAESPPPLNPNVPAVTGDRQAVPKPREDSAEANTKNSTAVPVTVSQRPKYLEYALKFKDKEAKIPADLKTGYILPADVTLIDIPAEFDLARYRLAVANQKALLVDPSSRRIEQVID